MGGGVVGQSVTMGAEYSANPGAISAASSLQHSAWHSINPQLMFLK